MNQSTFTRKSTLECLVLGHYDLGFDFHEGLQRSKGLNSGEYRNLRTDFITLDDRKLPFLEVLNELTGQRMHWTEMTQVAPVYITSFLRHLGINAEFSSFFHARKAELDDLFSQRPKVVAVTTTLYLTPLVAKEVVQLIREKSPDSLIVVGGPLIDNLAYHLEDADFRLILEEIGGDLYVQQKQGEQTLANLLLRLREGGDLSKVRNCYVKWQGKFVFTGAEAEFSLSPINWDNYKTKELGMTLQTRTALSCPFRCTFCDYPVRAGKWVPQEISSVEIELRQIQERNARNLVFIDDTFNVPADRFKEILRMMIRNEFTFRWYSYLRCNIMDEELCELMSRSNCAGVFLGIESGDADVLKVMKKVASPEQYLNGMKILKEAGIMTFASLIVGFPGETERSVDNTIQLLQDAEPTFFRGEIWYNNPRAPIYSKSKDQYGIEGFGYKWQHNSMEWEQGCEMVMKLFRSVSNSTWLPMYDFDFWILPYLEGKGISLDQVTKFVNACDDLLSMEIGVPRGGVLLTDRPAAENRLREIGREIKQSSFASAAVC